MRVFLTIALIAAPLALTSCIRPPWGGDDADEPTPMIAESDAGDVGADGQADPVRRAEPLVQRGGQDPMPILMPAAPGSTGLSEPHAATATTKPAQSEPARLADGAWLGRRAGHLRPDGDGGWTFEFSDDPDAPPLPAMAVLPGSMLEPMEQILADSDGEAVLFEVSGEVTRYRGRCYLIIGRAVVRTGAPTTGPSE